MVNCGPYNQPTLATFPSPSLCRIIFFVSLGTMQTSDIDGKVYLSAVILEYIPYIARCN